MNKLYDRIDFHNGTTPALNETNLNAMSKAIDDIDSRILTMGDVITALESSATASANSASASATSASASATSASSSATSASNSATSASASASSASSSATSAQASAEEARRFTPTGYDELVNDVSSVKSDLSNFADGGYLPKNLLNPFELSSNYVTVDSDGTIHGKGVTDTRALSYSACDIKLTLDAGTYTITRTNSVDDSADYHAIRVFNDSNTALANNTSASTFSMSFTLTETTNIGIFVKTNNGVFTLQLEKGSTATTYVPYIPPNTEITSIKKSLSYYQDNGYVPKDNLVATIEQGTVYQNTFPSATDRVRVTWIPVESNKTYKLNTNVSNVQYIAYYYNASKQYTTVSGGWLSASEQYLTPSTNDKYICVAFRYSNDATITPSALSDLDIREYLPSNSTIKTALTPQFLTSSITNNTSYVNNLGNTSVIKIGNIAIVSLHFNLSTQGTNGALLISGLPKNASGKILYTNIVSTSSMIGLQMNNGDNKLYCTNNATVGWYCGQLIYCTE